MPRIVQVEELHSGYGEVDILHGVSVHLNEGEIVTLIGPNGAGKSTLIKTIFGLLTPTQGRVLYDGADITGTPPEAVVRMGLSYMPQVENIFPHLTVKENLEMGGIIHGRVDLRPRIGRVFDIFPNLQGKEGMKAGNLSGGEQHMVALGKTLMQDPRVLLVDEPSVGLAPQMVDTILEKIQAINREGTTVLMVEQNARKALKISNRGYVLEMGQTRFDGSAADLLNNPQVGRLFLGG
ncbi:MAG: ABC transporter ATP-binding protein [Candidatus Thermoplasmatota archaeon]|nr:ABC transporter ATP-binding protein [Candidatus Thermoplasmatota archaeon]